MANVLVDETALQDIADAIRAKNGTQNTYKPGQMADAIEAIPSGGITPTGTINITQNGTIDVTQYASANVAVPNSYAAADESKVVSNGALVAQTSKNISANGTVDTTLNNQVVVAVPNSYAASDEGKVVSNGALVAQGSDTVTQNGTVDTTLINSLIVNVPTGGGSGFATGTVTPESRTFSISFDTGMSDIHGVCVIPTDESPMKSNGRTVYGFTGFDPGTTLVKSFIYFSNTSGSALQYVGVDASNKRFSVSGTTVTVSSNNSTGYWEAVEYQWIVW